MKKSVYLDSTIFSFYYDERPASLHRQQITADWWETQRKFYDNYTSYFVIKEVSNPVYPHWNKVAALAQQIPVLEDTPEIRGIVKVYLANKLMPADDAGDAAHLAIASYYSMDFLLTWNCIHLANANKVEHIRQVNMRLGLFTPDLITPEQLYMEETI
jgi:predicted nucleic acid-binding protein